MRVHNNDTQNIDSNDRVDEAKRRTIKRFASLACLVLLGACCVGCQSTKSAKNDKTVDDFLQADKPKW